MLAASKARRFARGDNIEAEVIRAMALRTHRGHGWTTIGIRCGTLRGGDSDRGRIADRARWGFAWEMLLESCRTAGLLARSDS